ncbi:MAG: PAS domain S-box protein [Hyphomicrobiales bacterium]|nr:MAG: PAS domain S-box protein [Hyphomicrobiales bacterium]
MAEDAVVSGLNPHESLRLIETHGVGTWTWDLETGQVRWSSGMSRILGVEHAATVQTLEYYEHLLHPDDRPDFRNPERVASSGVMVDRQYRVLRPNGELRWVQSFGTLIHSRDGRPERLTGVAFDVTDIRLGQLALQQRDGLLAAIRELFDVVIWQTDADGEISDEFEWWRATGQRGRVDGWNRLDAVHQDDRPKVRAAWDEAIRNRRLDAAAYRVLWGEAYVPVISRGVPILDRDGAIEGWICFTARQDGARVLDLGPAAIEHPPPPLAPGQVRAARGYLGWSAEQLAEHAGVSFSTVRRVETPGERGVRQQSISAIRKALERAGIVFTSTPDGRTGVSMK